MDRQQRKKSYKRQYIEGNTVRQFEVLPQQGGEHRKASSKKKSVKPIEKMPPKYIFLVATAFFLVMGMCALYVQLQTAVYEKMNQISSLENQILDLKMENDEAEKRVETSINLEEVKDTAINKMGMVYPQKEQIVYFQVEDVDYMNQYQDIPE